MVITFNKLKPDNFVGKKKKNSDFLLKKVVLLKVVKNIEAFK